MADDDAQSLLVPFVGALQACIAVILTILTGVIAAQYRLLTDTGAREISQIGVNLFLPALLITNVGQEVDTESIKRYIPVFIWALTYGLASLLFGMAMTKIFKLPAWATPAITFNNTTSLPLLFVQSLASTGLLDALDSSGNAVERAKSYFLVNALVGNTLTFALGPKLLNVWEESAEEPEDKYDDDGRAAAEEQRHLEHEHEETSLLPSRIAKKRARITVAAHVRGHKFYKRLPKWAREVLNIVLAFVNPPITGATIGLLIGLIPALHRLFFNTTEDGGYLKAWLETALENIGEVFPSLMTVIVGVKLSESLMRMKKGEDSGDVSWAHLLLITAVRFIIWPAISISTIYYLASRTNLLSDDPILWFCMMLAPAGPPGLILLALADLAGSDEHEKLGIAKFLTIEYAVSPIMFVTVVGALKASEAANKS